jgi:hypothetical protein
MIGVTSFGLFLTPIFYVLLRSLVAARHKGQGPDQPVAADNFADVPDEELVIR